MRKNPVGSTNLIYYPPKVMKKVIQVRDFWKPCQSITGVGHMVEKASKAALVFAYDQTTSFI